MLAVWRAFAVLRCGIRSVVGIILSVLVVITTGTLVLYTERCSRVLPLSRHFHSNHRHPNTRLSSPVLPRYIHHRSPRSYRERGEYYHELGSHWYDGTCSLVRSFFSPYSRSILLRTTSASTYRSLENTSGLRLSSGRILVFLTESGAFYAIIQVRRYLCDLRRRHTCLNYDHLDVDHSSWPFPSSRDHGVHQYALRFQRISLDESSHDREARSFSLSSPTLTPRLPRPCTLQQS